MRLVSLVIPTLREDAIGETLTRLTEHVLPIHGYRFEILLADDSDAAHRELLDQALLSHRRRYGAQVPAQRVDGPHTGKGGALRVGMLASRGEVVFTIDADLPVPLGEIEVFLARLEAGNDVVIGERPFNRNLREPVRFVASRALLVLQQAFVFQSRAFADTQCGFKAYRGDLARELAAGQIVDGGMADIEYLYAARRRGCRVAQVAVTSNPETRESRINVKRALWQDPLDLVRIKLRGLRGGS